jgi:hypothetical protein
MAVSVDLREHIMTLLQSQGKMSQILEDVVYPELKQMHKKTHDQISALQKTSSAAHENAYKALVSLDRTSRITRKAIQGVARRFDVDSTTYRSLILGSSF